jgi:hypothetical protein
MDCANFVGTMKKILLMMFVLSSLSCFGQVFRFQQFCQTGGQLVVTQGINSTNHVQRSYPSCTVKVYQTGTSTLATIYADSLLTPLANPFTANTDGSFGFFAASTPCYDVVISGGNPGDTLAAPFTFANVCLGGGGSGGSTFIPCPTNLVNGAIGYSNGAGGFNCDDNFTTDGSGNWISQSGQTVGPFSGMLGVIGGGTSPGTAAKYKLAANEFRLLGTTLVTPYYLSPPPTIPVAGQVIGALTPTTDGNGDTVVPTQWYTATNPCPDATTQTDIWVDPAGNDTTGDGTNGNPYQHISRAVQDIPVIVCSRYVINLKTAGTYDVSVNYAVDLSGHIWFGGGVGGYTVGGTAWPWLNNNANDSTQTGSWVEVRGCATPGDGVCDPRTYLLNGGAGSGGDSAFSVASGYLVLRGLEVQSAGIGVLAFNSVVQLAGVVIEDCITPVDAGFHSVIWLDKSDGQTGQWYDGVNDIYFRVQYTSLARMDKWIRIHDKSLLTDELADGGQTSSGAIIQIGGTVDKQIEGLVIGQSFVNITGGFSSVGEKTIGIIRLENNSYAYVGDYLIDGTGSAATTTKGVEVYSGSVFDSEGTFSLNTLTRGMQMDNGATVVTSPTLVSVTTPLVIINGNLLNDGSGGAYISGHLNAMNTSISPAGNKDLAGTCTAAAATTCAVSFSVAFSSAPVCVATDITADTAVQMTTSTSGITITTSGSTSDTFNYICIGNPR